MTVLVQPRGRMDDLPDVETGDPLGQLIDKEDEFARRIFQAWLDGWPEIRGWQFSTMVAGNSLQINCVRVTDEGRVWSSRDRIPLRELERARTPVENIAWLAKRRWNEFAEAKACLARECS